MREGDQLELRVTHDGWDGEGRAQLEGTTLSVSGGFAGERVQARLLELNRRRTLGRARTLSVLEPHQGRQEPACRHHPARGGRCDGCAFMPLSLEAQRAKKRQMLAELGLRVNEVRGALRPLGYRHSAKRVAFGRPGQLWLGSYQRGSHRGARMDDCLVDHPKLAEAARLLQQAARDRRIEAFDERTGRGDLRYVWLRTDGERVVATLVTAGRSSRAAQQLPDAVPEWIALAASEQPSAGNNLRGSPARTLRGTTDLSVALGAQFARVGPLGFVQPNPEVAAMCYAALVDEEADPPLTGELAVDLYAGAGVTTAMLRAHFREVIPNEAYPESAAALGVEPQDAADCVAELVARQAPVCLVTANPPRAGLSQATCEALRTLAAPRLHIMSCGPRGLARNVQSLTEEGPYRLRALHAFDTLPHTPHVELVAQLVRA